jgi:hypothetical protein
VNKDTIKLIYQEASGSLVYGHRVNVKSLKDTKGKVSNGVDYFFFDTQLTNIYRDHGLCIGQPAWDWWMVAVPASKKIPTKRVLSRIAYHKNHSKEWSQVRNQRLIESIVINKYIKPRYPDLTAEQSMEKLHEIVLNKNGIWL